MIETHCDEGNTLRERKNTTRKSNNKLLQEKVPQCIMTQKLVTYRDTGVSKNSQQAKYEHSKKKLWLYLRYTFKSMYMFKKLWCSHNAK